MWISSLITCLFLSIISWERCLGCDLKGGQDTNADTLLGCLPLSGPLVFLYGTDGESESPA